MENETVRQAVETLETAVSAIQDSESFRAYLDFQSKFYRYSPSNVLLIMSQYPDASMIAGYRSWQRMNRFVRKGEKSIRILAPLIRKDKETQEPKVFGYRAVPVFDVKQTDGQEIPTFEVPRLTSNDGEGLYDRMRQVSWDEGLLVQRSGDMFLHRMEAMGYYAPDQKKIAVRPDIAQLQATKTLAHELGHHFGEHKTSGPDTETQAEGVSYVVLKHFGLDSGERSFPYVATWAKDKNVLKANLGYIGEISKRLIMKIHPEDQSPPVEQ